MNVYKRIVNLICKFFEAFAGLCLAVMLLVVTFQVVMRYFFNAQPGWTEEIARQLMIIFCFIAMVLGVRDKIHISLTIIADRLLKRLMLPLELLGKFLIFVLGIMMSSFMGPYFSKLSFNKLPATGIPVGWIYVFPTAMGILMSLVAIYQMYDHLKYGTDEAQRGKGDFTKEQSAI